MHHNGHQRGAKGKQLPHSHPLIISPKRTVRGQWLVSRLVSEGNASSVHRLNYRCIKRPRRCQSYCRRVHVGEKSSSTIHPDCKSPWKCCCWCLSCSSAHLKRSIITRFPWRLATRALSLTKLHLFKAPAGPVDCRSAFGFLSGFPSNRKWASFRLIICWKIETCFRLYRSKDF